MAALSVFGTNQEFDEFLHAPVGSALDEMPLSVLSALTRLNLDPWEEASELSNLPIEAAIQRLATLIARLPTKQSGKLDCAEAATRLVALLPRTARGISLPGAKMINGINLPRTPFRPVIVLFVAMMLSTAVLLLAMAREQASQSSPPQHSPSNRSLPQSQ